MTTLTPLDASRARRLKAHTQALHGDIDQAIGGAGPFRNRERYGAFLRMQYHFHQTLAPLYVEPALVAALPDLPTRARYDAVAQDLHDLGQPLPTAHPGPLPALDPTDHASAWGWLYVAEGSNLGAAFLLKAVAALGLDEQCGARHLAAHPDGRAAHWRDFTAALDAQDFTEAEEARAEAAATQAFGYVQALAREVLVD